MIDHVMMEFLQFTFQSGWHFFGVLILLCVPLIIVGAILGDTLQRRRS